MKDSTVFIVDDDPSVLKSVQSRLRSAGMLVHIYHSAEQFILDFRPHNVACLIVDLQMPGMTGIKLIEWLRSRHIEMPVIVLSGHGNIPAVVESMKLGVADFVEKPADDHILVNRVRELLQSQLARREQLAETQEIRDRFATLTGREKELVELLATGLSSKQIARRVGIAVKTVENHRAHLLAKTRATNVASLVRMRMIAVDHAVVA
jgi:two-component system, LuxR family, response regulator FixJ